MVDVPRGYGGMRESCPVASNNLSNQNCPTSLHLSLFDNRCTYNKPIWGLFCYLELNILAEIDSLYSS